MKEDKGIYAVTLEWKSAKSGRWVRLFLKFLSPYQVLLPDMAGRSYPPLRSVQVEILKIFELETGDLCNLNKREIY